MSLQMAEFTLERKGCQLHFWTSGNPQGPLLVLTHGATIDHMEWSATIPLLEEKYKILTWDVRGHGLSRPCPFDLADAVDDLIAILDRLQVPQAIFIGHSMGGNLHQ